MNRFTRNLLLVLSLVLAVVFISRGGGMNGSGPERTEKSLSELWAMLEKPQPEVNSGYIQKDTFFFEDNKGNRYRTRIPDPGDRADLYATLKKSGVKFEIRPPLLSDSIQNLLLAFLPIIVIVALWMFFLRQAQQGGNQAMAFGRSRAKRVTENVPKVTFDDVAGVNEAKQELQEVVEFLKNPRKFQALGAKIPRGVLLLGPPGSGKTLLARAVAGEAGVPFFHISGSDFVEMFVGVGASRVRDLFDTAKANRPSLVFIDEIDAVGRQRGAGLGGGHDEREQTLNQLLVEMDGFDPNSGVILIAATNRPDVLDPALLRPGRFDRRVVVDNPDAEGRKAILQVHTRGKPLADDVNLDSLARRTPGFSGADLANLVNEAALLAARRDKTKITMDEFEASVDRVIAGPERRSRLISEKEKRVVAYHEVGHALVMELLPNGDPVHKVSILPRGLALGYTMALPGEDKYLTTRDELLDDITGLLGGRAAEQIVFNQMTTGANNDLDRATDIARRMVCEYGMSEELGPITLGRRHGNPFLGRDIMEDRNYSEEVAEKIDAEVRRIIESCYDRAMSILTEHRAKMDEISELLLERETIEREEFERLMAGLSTKRLVQPQGPGDAGGGQPAAQEEPRPAPEAAPRLEPGVA
ncbi:MAG: ATP-dependent zinc metalloprotease FtsH [Armatimonadota bacterium]|nr:MAG: ATP-dependent zinc metalloprotease FtsH [Armatimonadota bacterium]